MISKYKFIQYIYDVVWGKIIFVGFYDRFLKASEKAGLGEIRKKVVSQAKGHTLEIAAGTALNLPYYPSEITDLTLTDYYPTMLKKVRQKVKKSGRKATVMKADAENLPFEDNSFDTVVASMILCSTENPSKILTEIHRVLKKGGQYLFFEHVRNSNPKIAHKQDCVQPAWYLFGNGCNCNRDSSTTINNSPLEITEMKKGSIPKAWDIVKEIIIGRAIKPMKPKKIEKKKEESSSACGCSLDAEALQKRKENLFIPLKMKAAKLRRTRKGYMITLPKEQDNLEIVTSIVLLESKCCPFFKFNVSVKRDIVFKIDAPKENQGLLDDLFDANAKQQGCCK
jgi:ubiquinone/menaquinone biosynthesis C-methylase UbiE